MLLESYNGWSRPWENDERSLQEDPSSFFLLETALYPNCHTGTYEINSSNYLQVSLCQKFPQKSNETGRNENNTLRWKIRRKVSEIRIKDK